MSIDPRRAGTLGSVIAGIAVLHGLSTRRWRHIHTFGVALGIASAVAPLAGLLHRSETNEE